MNILITSAGRRVSLVKAFISSAKILSSNSKIYVTDLDPYYKSPASHFSDKAFKVGYFNDPSYIKDLLEICLKNNVTVIIPTIDTELYLLADSKNLFKNNGIDVIISENELIKKFADKVSTNLFFNSIGIKTPHIYKKNNLKFPIFLKPRYGSNSKGVYVAKNLNEIKPVDLDSENILKLRFLDNEIFDEYTIDLYYDKNSILKCVVPRVRLKVVGGESNQGITKKNKVFHIVKEKFKYLEGARGCLTLQLFSKKSNPSEIFGIEINPRFGGGYPFSYNAGANFPDFIIREYILSESIEYFEDWNDNCLNLRFEDEVIIND